MDVIGDMLTSIRNAQAVKKETAYVPYSKIKMNIAEILVSEGYLKEAVRRGRKNKKMIGITMKYDEDGDPAIRKIERVSKLSKRVYLPLGRIHGSGAGRSTQILTTSKGILTNIGARKEKVGGEIICEIWK